MRNVLGDPRFIGLNIAETTYMLDPAPVNVNEKPSTVQRGENYFDIRETLRNSQHTNVIFVSAGLDPDRLQKAAALLSQINYANINKEVRPSLKAVSDEENGWKCLRDKSSSSSEVEGNS